ncbi:MAG: hypothetical protein Q4G63_05655 [Bacteroidia bacterium]|nr:hypothetical protein [Bacteroidia bacterium]
MVQLAVCNFCPSADGLNVNNSVRSAGNGNSIHTQPRSGLNFNPSIDGLVRNVAHYRAFHTRLFTLSSFRAFR